jgi:precorrin-6B methylase 2
VIEAKGHTLVGTDFEAFDAPEQYDAIVMNPPWSGGADVRHVMRAYGMLKPGGRLVALMSMHPSFAQDKASQAFRGWMEGLGGSSQKIPASDFASQWMSGGIPSWLVRVEKPMTKALFFRPAA